MNVMVVRSLLAIGGWGHGVSGYVSGRVVVVAIVAAMTVAVGCALAARTSRRRSQSPGGIALLRSPWTAPVVVLASWNKRHRSVRKGGFQ